MNSTASSRAAVMEQRGEDWGMWGSAGRSSSRRSIRPSAAAYGGSEPSWEEQAFARDAAANLGGCVWPPSSYTCSFCQREFRSAQALGGHMNVHRRDRARLRQSSSSPGHKDEEAEASQDQQVHCCYTSFSKPSTTTNGTSNDMGRETIIVRESIKKRVLVPVPVPARQQKAADHDDDDDLEEASGGRSKRRRLRLDQLPSCEGAGVDQQVANKVRIITSTAAASPSSSSASALVDQQAAAASAGALDLELRLGTTPKAVMHA